MRVINHRHLDTQFATLLELLADIIGARINGHFNSSPVDITSIARDRRWLQVIRTLQLDETYSVEEVIVLMAALAPHLKPAFYEDIMARKLPEGGEFIEFGGVKGTNYRGMLPTGDTALFILAGTDPDRRLQARKVFGEESRLATHGLCYVETVKNSEPAMSGRLLPDEDWLDRILLGKESIPTFSIEFPARRVTTQMTWADLVLHPRTLEQVEDIQLWMQFQSDVEADSVLARKIKPGYRVLFYGPSGTGKTLTATLLGKQFNTPIYRIDLSQVVSKYIGETEKHIEWVFTRAARKKWILFFDEADALFGRRTAVQTSHDRFANQEVSYLLQRIEEYDGLLILASNFKNNIDEAFLRRFHNIVHFPMPNEIERYKLWTKCVPESIAMEPGLNWQEIASSYEMSGAGIVNVIHFASLRAFSRKERLLRKHDIVEGIRKEYAKEEKAI